MRSRLKSRFGIWICVTTTLSLFHETHTIKHGPKGERRTGPISMTVGDTWPPGLTEEQAAGKALMPLEISCLGFSSLTENRNPIISFDPPTRDAHPALLSPRVSGYLDQLAMSVKRLSVFGGTETLRVVQGYQSPPADATAVTLFNRGLAARITLTEAFDKLSDLAVAAVEVGFDFVSFDSSRSIYVAAREGLCSRPLDILIMVDSSTSLDPALFNDQVRPFVSSMIGGFTIGENETQIGVAQFRGQTASGESVIPLINFSDYENSSSFQTIVESMPQAGLPRNGGGPGTFTEDAVKYAHGIMANSSRGGHIGRVVIFILASAHDDNNPSCVSCQNPGDAARALRQEGVTIHILSVNTTDAGLVADINAMATSPVEDHTTILSEMTLFTDPSTTPVLLDAICRYPTYLYPGETIKGKVRPCELIPFASSCPTPNYLATVEILSAGNALQIYTNPNGIGSPVEFTNTLVVTSTDNGVIGDAGDISVTVQGRSSVIVEFVLEAWFDRYNGYFQETVAGSKVTQAVAEGTPLYTPPIDGNRDLYDIESLYDGANAAVNKLTGVVLTIGDIIAPGTIRVRVTHPTEECLISFINVIVQTVQVSGTVYIDTNGNGNQDSEEIGLGGLVITLQARRQGGATVRTESDSSGRWVADVEFGEILVSIDISPNLAEITEGTSTSLLDVSASTSTFPTIGLQPRTTTGPSTSIESTTDEETPEFRSSEASTVANTLETSQPATGLDTTIPISTTIASMVTNSATQMATTLPVTTAITSETYDTTMQQTSQSLLQTTTVDSEGRQVNCTALREIGTDLPDSCTQIHSKKKGKSKGKSSKSKSKKKSHKSKKSKKTKKSKKSGYSDDDNTLPQYDAAALVAGISTHGSKQPAPLTMIYIVVASTVLVIVGMLAVNKGGNLPPLSDIINGYDMRLLTKSEVTEQNHARSSAKRHLLSETKDNEGGGQYSTFSADSTIKIETSVKPSDLIFEPERPSTLIFDAVENLLGSFRSDIETTDEESSEPEFNYHIPGQSKYR
eukprot:m.8408 g.8408  ORF g.8408 m.8408 type:complete len:1024 (+) comp3884_c0_seq1:110-3181(+)